MGKGEKKFELAREPGFGRLKARLRRRHGTNLAVVSSHSYRQLLDNADYRSHHSFTDKQHFHQLKLVEENLLAVDYQWSPGISELNLPGPSEHSSIVGDMRNHLTKYFRVISAITRASSPRVLLLMLK